MKKIVYFYIGLAIALLVACSYKINIGQWHPLMVQIPVAASAIIALVDILLMVFHGFQLFFNSENDWIEASAMRQRTEAYPGIPLAISRTQADGELARKQAEKKWFKHFALFTLQAICLFLLAISAFSM